MSELPRIEARLRALSQVREVIRAMRGLASARLRGAERVLAATARYREIVAESHRRLRGVVDAPAGDGPPAVLVITAEHGFVGAFSRQIAERVRARPGPAAQPFVVGRRGAARLEELGLRPRLVLPQAPHPTGVVAAAREVVWALGRPARLRLLYPRPVAGGFDLAEERVPEEAPAPTPRAGVTAPRTHLPLAALDEALAEELVRAAVIHALAAAFAAETAMRLRTCEQAGRNIDRRAEELVHLRHRLRQETITTELLDVVTGAEALRRTAAQPDHGAD
ncbi:ATP synthase gamma chain [bacterium HR39]|nr:ATP synthase gamma chain [bacterium HR39]